MDFVKSLCKTFGTTKLSEEIVSISRKLVVGNVEYRKAWHNFRIQKTHGLTQQKRFTIDFVYLVGLVDPDFFDDAI